MASQVHPIHAIHHALPTDTALHQRYRILQTLGQGGFAITYLAQHEALARIVVIKEYFPYQVATRQSNSTQVFPNTETEFQTGLENFIREARLLTQFDHANIVRVIDLFLENGTAYYVMPYYQGQTLENYLTEKGNLDENTVLTLFRPIMDGLREAHQKGILHRDIKPDNIYLAQTASGGVNPILLDFGSARKALRHGFTVLITPGFAPLEQYDPTAQQDERVDVYGLCATMYFALCGKLVPDATTRANMEEALDGLDELTLSSPLKQTIYDGLALKTKDRIPNLLSLSQKLYANTQSRSGIAQITHFSATAFEDTRPIPKLDPADIPTSDVPVFENTVSTSIDFAKTRAIPQFTEIDSSVAPTINQNISEPKPSFMKPLAEKHPNAPKFNSTKLSWKRFIMPASAVLLLTFFGGLGYQVLLKEDAKTNVETSSTSETSASTSVVAPRKVVKPVPKPPSPQVPDTSYRTVPPIATPSRDENRTSETNAPTRQTARTRNTDTRGTETDANQKRIDEIARKRENERLARINKQEIREIEQKISLLRQKQNTRERTNSRQTESRRGGNTRQVMTERVRRNIEQREMQELERQLETLRQQEANRKSAQRRNTPIRNSLQSARSTIGTIRRKVENVIPKRNNTRPVNRSSGNTTSYQP